MLNLPCIITYDSVPNHRQKNVASRNKNELTNNLAVKAGDLLIQYLCKDSFILEWNRKRCPFQMNSWESNLKFTFSSDKDQRKNSRSLNVNEPYVLIVHHVGRWARWQCSAFPSLWDEFRRRPLVRNVRQWPGGSGGYVRWSVRKTAYATKTAAPHTSEQPQPKVQVEENSMGRSLYVCLRFW